MSDRDTYRPSGMSRPVLPGMAVVERGDGEWWNVAIGRDRTVKRFNLTRGEAAALVEALCRDVLTGPDGDGPCGRSS